MKLAQVLGAVIASIKARGLAAHKLLLQAVAASNPLGESALQVLRRSRCMSPLTWAEPESAKSCWSCTDGQSVPADVAVVAIVDSVQLDGRTTFVKP